MRGARRTTRAESAPLNSTACQHRLDTSAVDDAHTRAHTHDGRARGDARRAGRARRRVTEVQGETAEPGCARRRGLGAHVRQIGP
eukprot:IDg13841t1